MLTAQDVVSGYKLILNREPESPAIIENFVKYSNFDHLRKTLLGSEEFAERLSRDAQLLGISMAALTMAEEVRRYQSRLESLVSLALPLWNCTVLIIGDEPSILAGFFLDRKCRVCFSAAPDTTELLQRLLQVRQHQAANTSVVSLDFSKPIDEHTLGQFDLVYGELPDESSDAMRNWLDNAVVACTETLIVTCRTAPGRSEDVFVTPSPRTPSQLRTIPTTKWVFARLQERFEHIYEPALASSDNSFFRGNSLGTSEAYATYVASRHTVSSPTLKEYISPPVRALLSQETLVKTA